MDEPRYTFPLRVSEATASDNPEAEAWALRQNNYNFPVEPSISHGKRTECVKHGDVETSVYGGCADCLDDYTGYRLQFGQFIMDNTCRCPQCFLQLTHGVAELERLANLERDLAVERATRDPGL